MTDTDRTDQLIAGERARRPRWRSAAARPAPAWFRGEELDLVDRDERRRLYLAAKARMAPVPWVQYAVLVPGLLFLDLRRAPAWHWPLLLGIAVLVVGIATSTILRRRLIRRMGREALRESADWPQRLAQLRA